MEATLDRFGRVVIPKKVREDLGLKAGDVLNIQEEAGKVVLEPAGHKPLLVRKKGVLVFTGELIGDPGDVTNKDREARNLDLLRRAGF